MAARRASGGSDMGRRCWTPTWVLTAGLALLTAWIVLCPLLLRSHHRAHGHRYVLCGHEISHSLADVLWTTAGCALLLWPLVAAGLGWSVMRRLRSVGARPDGP